MNEKRGYEAYPIKLGHISEIIAIVNNVDATTIKNPYGIKFNEKTVQVFVNANEHYTYLNKHTRLIFTNNKDKTWILKNNLLG